MDPQTLGPRQGVSKLHDYTHVFKVIGPCTTTFPDGLKVQMGRSRVRAARYRVLVAKSDFWKMSIRLKPKRLDVYSLALTHSTLSFLIMASKPFWMILSAQPFILKNQNREKAETSTILFETLSIVKFSFVALTHPVYGITVTSKLNAEGVRIQQLSILLTVCTDEYPEKDHPSSLI